MLTDKRTIFLLLGTLVKQPELILDIRYNNLSTNDFPESFHKIVFGAIKNLAQQGTKELSPFEIDSFLSHYPPQYDKFTKNNGVGYLEQAMAETIVDNFDYYYHRIKKFSLLQDFIKQGIDVSDIYNPQAVNENMDLGELNESLDNMSLNDIINKVQEKIVKIQHKYNVTAGQHGQQAGKGLVKLKEKLKQAPEMGVGLCSEYLTTICRGARLSKLYMRSSPSGCGKTRLSLADALNIAIDEIYDINLNMWIPNGTSEPTQFITTELNMDEIQTMALAFVTGINEEKILDGDYTPEEEKRIDYGIKVIERCNLWIEHLPNFNIEDIEQTVQRDVITRKLKYVFFDYIHTSMKLLEELSQSSKGMKLREDNILLMFVDRLKALCNRLGVFCFTSTQVNGEWKTAKDADQNLLRGAKAMADKIDLGIIALEPTSADITKIMPLLKAQSIIVGKVPNLVYNVYKNRRGKWVRMKIWVHVDLGTLRTTDLLVTKYDYQVVDIEKLKILTKSKVME